jgi:DNA-binding transcriptional LysR family regulator
MEYKNLPDLKALITLKAVAELGGVEKAAQALHLGQPAITKRLRSLEKTYGLKLMQRKGRRLELTAAGEKVYDFAHLISHHQRFLLDDLTALRDGEKLLRLEVTHAIGEHLLPGLLLQFAESFPEYRIRSRLGYSMGIQTRLATGIADLGLLELAPDHPDILVQQWLDDEILLVCGTHHPLCQRSPIAISDLGNLRYVLRESTAAMRLLLDKTLADIGINELPVVMEVGSSDAIIEMLQQGQHASFLPRFAVAGALAEESLSHIKIQGLRIKRTLWIARTRTNLDNPVAEAFIRHIKGNLR